MEHDFASWVSPFNVLAMENWETHLNCPPAELWGLQLANKPLSWPFHLANMTNLAAQNVLPTQECDEKP